MKRLLGIFLAAALGGGCAVTSPVLGLRPESPRAGSDFVPVEGRRPTLRWEAFPQPRDRESDPRLLAATLDVTYDLRVWEAVFDDYPGHLAYAKDGLPEPRHRVETDLKPDTRYVWTVRARFNLDGRARVTPWSTVTWGHHVARRVVPDLGYFRFRTPASEEP